jgi:hypothetical protein
MIACVRPSYWTETWGVDAAKVLDAALKTDHAHELLAGFTEAALRHPSEDWLEALCDRSIPRREKDDEALALTQNLVRLLEAAPPSARDRLLLSVLRKLEPARFDVAVAALGSAKARWSSDVTKAACSLLAEIVRNDSRPFPHPRTTLAEWGVRADVGTGMQTVPTLLDKLADGSPWRNAIEHLTDTLRFRADMQQELSQ